MRTVQYSVGRVLAAFGAVGLLASLFMPWYGPPSADSLTIFGNAAVVDWFSGKRNPDGRQALSVIDIYLAALAVVAVVTCAFSHGRAMRLLTVATTAAAAVGVGLIVYRLIEPFAPFHEPIYGPSGKPLSVNSFVDPRIGIFVALASAVAIFAGSILISFRSWRFRSITGSFRDQLSNWVSCRPSQTYARMAARGRSRAGKRRDLPG